MRTFWAQPLRRQLLMANLLLAIPVFGLAAWEGGTTYFERQEELERRAFDMAAMTAASIDRDLENFGSLAARLWDVHTLEPRAIQARLVQLTLGRQAVRDVVLTDRHGRGVAHTAPGPLPEGSLPWAQPVLAHPEAGARGGGRIEPQADDGGPPGSGIVLAYPVLDANRQLTGAVGIYLDLSSRHEVFSLRQLPAGQGLPGGSILAIADEEGRVLAQSLGPQSPGTGIYAGNAGELPFEGLSTGQDGIQRRYAAMRISGGPWLVAVGITAGGALEATVMALARSVSVAGLVLAGCFLMAWFVSRRVDRSVSHLETTARRIATGDFSPIERRPMFSPEFAELQAAFEAMLHQFNETRAALDAQMAEERRIRKELESLQGQVIQQERLAAVGQLVSGVAHEINNPLQAILGFAELLQMQSDVPENVKSDLRLIQKESTRACNIIRNLAMFARQQPGEAGPVLMCDVILSVAELRQRRLQSEDIELHIDDTARQPVKAVITELQQVLLNFVVNAEQAILNSGRLPGRITIRAFDNANRVVLEVEDTGPGVKPSDEAKLFQPFFTTKPVGQGTGLGLSISYGIIDSLGGTIGYRRSAVGGAIFYFELPVAPPSVDDSHRTPASSLSSDSR